MTDGPPARADAHVAVKQLAAWSGWKPFAEAAELAPRTPGVYMFRLPQAHDIVYVGMAGPRTGSGAAQGLRGRLSIYARGRGAVSGFGEAALDRALADADWLEGQVASLRADGPKRTKRWAQEAIAFLAPQVCWTECAGKSEALLLEKQVEDLLSEHGLWNRRSEKLRAGQVVSADIVVEADENVEPDYASAISPVEVSASDHLVIFTLEGHTIDLDVLYRAMHRYSVVTGGERVFNGLAKETPAVKRLLNQLFDAPVTDKIHPVNHAIRRECRDRLAALGWATKGSGRSARYVLHRGL